MQNKTKMERTLYFEQHFSQWCKDINEFKLHLRNVGGGRVKKSLENRERGGGLDRHFTERKHDHYSNVWKGRKKIFWPFFYKPQIRERERQCGKR